MSVENTLSKEILEDVSSAIDTLSNYAEEIHWHTRDTLVSLLDDLYSEEVLPYLTDKED